MGTNTANTAVVEQAYAAFGRGDIASVIDVLDDNVEWSSPRTLPHGGEFQGKADVGRFFEGLGAAWETLGLTVETVGEVTNGVVVGVVRADGSRRGGGPAGYGAAHRFDVRNGKITRFREYVDLDKPID